MSTKLRQDKSKQANEKDSITLLQRLCCFSANKQARLSKIVPINTEPKQETKNIDNQPSLQKDFSVFGKQKRFPTIRIERLTNPIDVSQISDLSNNDFEIIKTTQSTPESIGKHNFKLPLTRLDSNLNAIPQYEDNWEIQPTVTHINYKESQTKKQQFKGNIAIFQVASQDYNETQSQQTNKITKSFNNFLLKSSNSFREQYQESQPSTKFFAEKVKTSQTCEDRKFDKNQTNQNIHQKELKEVVIEKKISEIQDKIELLLSQIEQNYNHLESQSLKIYSARSPCQKQTIKSSQNQNNLKLKGSQKSCISQKLNDSFTQEVYDEIVSDIVIEQPNYFKRTLEGLLIIKKGFYDIVQQEVEQRLQSRWKLYNDKNSLNLIDSEFRSQQFPKEQKLTH